MPIVMSFLVLTNEKVSTFGGLPSYGERQN
uniref:Uncharacterized protein n=1 Tax=Anguilla anguilla TaxID=7936 RepID=A0A0E9WBK8_ANGAN